MWKELPIGKIIVLPTRVIFLINVGSDGEDTYIGKDINPGMHWTICILHRDTETQDSSLRKLFGLEDATLPARKNTTVCHIFVVKKRSRIQHKILSRHRRYFRS